MDSQDGSLSDLIAKTQKARDSMVAAVCSMSSAAREAAEKLNECGRMLMKVICSQTAFGDLNFQILRWERKQRNFDRYQRRMARGKAKRKWPKRF